MKRANKEGCWFKGAFMEYGGVCYLSQTEPFTRNSLSGISRTLRAEQNDAGVCVKEGNDMAKIYRIRKLTPTECMRLMGVYDQDTRKMKEAGISDSQLYKMAGNSIVVDVLEGIFTQLLRKDSESLF